MTITTSMAVATGDQENMALYDLRLLANRLVPKAIARILEDRRWTRIRQQYGQLSVEEAFSQTYDKKLWGNVDDGEYFSGAGSLDKFAKPYVLWLSRFIREHEIRTVVDLGCGDYRVGRQLCASVSINYIGVDIVPQLTDYNQSRFGSDKVRFECVNIIDEELPDGELCLIRQVLQHLSNTQISQVLYNCAKFSYLVVTEDVYSGHDMRPNLDIAHGPDNRWFRRSGVFLDRPPFTLPTKNILEIPFSEDDSVLRTCLIERPPFNR